MKTYTAEQQQALSAAMKIAAPGSPFVAFIQDYFQMREANRACLKG